MRARHGLTVTVMLGLVLMTPKLTAQAPPPVQAVTPFDVIGFIEAATIDDPQDVLSGGTIRVNGTTFIVPRNTILQFPASASSWQGVFKNAPPPYSPSQSGLALTDVPKPALSYEAHLVGNRVVTATADRHIVGLMFLAQQSLNKGAGFINYIDYGAGEMRVGGTIGDPSTGARVRINDPLGRHGIARHVDDRFTVDEDNPTVRSETAYPMCLPRVAPPATDPLCPQVNRPTDPATGQRLTIFTMDPPPFDGGPAPTPTTTNPYLMAPFEVGDFISYSGNLVKDRNNGDGDDNYVLAWNMIADVGIFTQPGTQPTYVAVDVIILGIGGAPNPAFPQEATVRTRIEGFSTDRTTPVDLFAVDVEPCTGEESLRYYATVATDPGPVGGGAVAGRWRWRPNLEATFLPPTREIAAISENGALTDVNTGMPIATPNGLLAGQYVAPNFEFLFPENLGVGNPPVPNNFQDFPFLAHGSGPATATDLVGQLAPWPGDAAPVAAACTPSGAVKAPRADAGTNQFVSPLAPVTLDASLSSDTNSPPRPLTYAWQQIGGAPVTLLNVIGQPALRRFEAPDVVPGAPADVLKFQVTVSNGVHATVSAPVTVTVSNPRTAVDTVSIASAVYRTTRGRLLVTATTNDPTAQLTLVGFGPMGPGLPIAPGVPAPPGSFEYRIVGIPVAPDTVTVISSSGGTATLPVTVR